MVCKQERAPESLYIFRTTAPPAITDCTVGSGVHDNPLLGKHSHVVDLNSVARDIARRHDWQIVDMERFVAPFHHHNFFLRDPTHPDGNILGAALNSMLNLYRSSCGSSQPKQSMVMKHVSRLMPQALQSFPRLPFRGKPPPDHHPAGHDHPPPHHSPFHHGRPSHP